MFNVLSTQNSTFIIGWVAKILGYLMEGIFYVLDKIGIPNIGLSIIIFTIVIYMCLMPLTVKQQKFSKLSAKMNPELQAIQAKYKNKKDNDSMQAMNQETQAVYAKYGVSPSGSCIQMIIQMPILFALYRVIYAIPAYVGKVKDAFFPLVDDLIGQAGSAEFIQTFKQATYFSKQFTNESFTSGVTSYVQNTYIDVLNKASTAEWISLKEKFPAIANDITDTMTKLQHYNNFCGLNIGDSPSNIVKDSLSTGNYVMIVAAIMIPVLSALTQWLGFKLMPQQGKTGNEQADNMQQSMKTMNVMMPIMSAFFCYTLPAGMGIYWIAGAVIRAIQQIAINKHIDKMDLDEVIKKNKAKMEKKMEKAGLTGKLSQYATQSTKAIDSNAASAPRTMSNKNASVNTDSSKLYKKDAKAGSIASKVNMVSDYNDSNK